ncbi:MAG: TonB-dependent receptor [Prevotellaceae bacterium]|jgi:hypothetical protein|nr:TonB-dependent receptor [Prevotellaceae bacterium]
MNFKLLCISAFILGAAEASAQEGQPYGAIRGVVIDAASGQPLPFASVVALNASPAAGATTNEAGHFAISKLPVGRYDVQASLTGYAPATFREILVSSAKEAFVEISLAENMQALDEVVVRSVVSKEEPLNKMATVGARMLSVEEASRYAGGFDDPARLVSAFAGVAGSMNSNGIAIRGNSPQYLQWRIEGTESPNPTHFSEVTGVGGGILSALSSQVLGNSDFFTGAFPAEYSNALSGVFDMQLRSGNNQRYEHSVQVGTLGLEFASEGPFKKGGRASYLFNYRYATMSLAGKLFPGLLDDAAGIGYQDLSFKMNFPTRRAGTVSIWGIGLIDNYLKNPSKDTADWLNSFEDVDDFKQIKLMGGVGHKIFLDNNTYLKSALAVSYTQNHILMEQTYRDQSVFRVADMRGANSNVTLNTYLNRKFSAVHTNRTGINVTGLFYSLDYSSSPDPNDYPPLPMFCFAKSNGQSMLLSAFSQSTIRLSEKLTANVGLSGMYFMLTGRWAIEPRAGVKWQALPRHSFGAAYGKHSRHENLDYYFAEAPQASGRLANKSMDLTRAHHVVLSYDYSVSENTHLKVEPYCQYLYRVPVEADSLLSLINYQTFYLLKSLVNDGKGVNYGVDFTLERYLHNGYYYLLTASLFESRYSGGDGIWRSSRLSKNFLVNALGGKEWKMGRQKQNILGVNVRLSYQGGDRYIPADEAASKAAQKMVYDNARAYQAQLPSALLCHFTVSYKINRKATAHEVALKMINVTGYKEFEGYYYNYKANEPAMHQAAVVIPNICYKFDF